jgi:hypothetical protein
VVQIDEAMLAHLEPDRMGLALQRVVDLLASQQRSHDLDVLAERRQPHRPATEQAQRRVTGAEADEAPPWRQPVDRRDAVRHDRRQPQRRHVHAGTDTHGTRRLRSTAQQFDRMIGLSVTQQCV